LSSYGMDNGNKDLCKLLRALVKLKGVRWLRLLYLYPSFIDDELIKIVKNEEKLANYFDIPVQHLDDRILKKMSRSGTVNEYWELIQKIREEVNEVAIRTTLIVGFPGETDEIFNNVLEEVNRFKFNHLGVFEYSAEETTKSFYMENHIDPKIKKFRFKKIMALQAKISSELLKTRIGKTYDILVEEMIEGEKDQGNYYIGRSEFEAPEIDGNIVISSLNKLDIGKHVRVKIISSSEYDLFSIVEKNENLQINKSFEVISGNIK
ncbi:MAG: radical SAM protein, partial [Spirochaetota bacterium]|nr:radical SAM protein [Spirochaetota bacterium]